MNCIKRQTLCQPLSVSRSSCSRCQPRLTKLIKKQLNGKVSQIGKISLGLVVSAQADKIQTADIEEKSAEPLNIVFVSAEVAPWSKTGGLGDVVGGLPIELAARGHNVITIAPRYDQYSDAWDTSVTATLDGQTVRYFHIKDKGVDRIFVDHPSFLEKVWGKTGAKLYGPKAGVDFMDNQLRFKLFCQAAIEAVRVLPFGPGESCTMIVNDWHSALVPVLLKYVYKPKGEYRDAKVAFCIHNIAFQGRFWEESFKQLQLPEECFEDFRIADGYPKVFDESQPGTEDDWKATAPEGRVYKKICWMKAGILNSDKVLTVSPNYASEIVKDESLGVELDKVIKQAGGCEGIVNGMDTQDWDPKSDKYIEVQYDKESVDEGKALNKEALQAEVGLKVDASIPLFCFIGRLEEQKGLDILLQALPDIADLKCQLIILGTGKAKYEKLLKTIKQDNVKGVVKFSTPLAHMMFAGSDFIVVPSRFEPCGLIQLQAMQYGSIPLVSSCGGLVDTVKEGVTGYQMAKMNPDEMDPADVQSIVATLKRAIADFQTPKFYKIRYSGIQQDLSWKQPAKKWEAVVEELVHGAPAGQTKKESVKTPVTEPSVADAVIS